MRTSSVPKALKISASAITSHLHLNPLMLALQPSPPVVKGKANLSLTEGMETSNGWRSASEEGGCAGICSNWSRSDP